MNSGLSDHLDKTRLPHMCISGRSLVAWLALSNLTPSSYHLEWIYRLLAPTQTGYYQSRSCCLQEVSNFE